jgi:hypothetical protein
MVPPKGCATHHFRFRCVSKRYLRLFLSYDCQNPRIRAGVPPTGLRLNTLAGCPSLILRIQNETGCPTLARCSRGWGFDTAGTMARRVWSGLRDRIQTLHCAGSNRRFSEAPEVLHPTLAKITQEWGTQIFEAKESIRMGKGWGTRRTLRTSRRAPAATA